MPDETATFESVDWDRVGTGRALPRAEVLTFAVGLVVLLGLFLYDRYIAHVYLVFDWQFEYHVWTFVFGCLVIISFGVIPAIKYRRRTASILRSLLLTPRTAFAIVVLGLFVLVGLFGPVHFEAPIPSFHEAFTPPIGFSAEHAANNCGGEVTGEPFNRVCEGTWEHPLGTDIRGFPMEFLIVEGARIALYVAIFAAAFIVPLAVITGVVAGLRGGLVDDLLMSYVDVQLTLPAIILYFIGYIYWNVSLMLLLATFGLLSWGGVARLVRSETLQRREEGHVTVARGLGASESYIAVRHILPNISNTVVPAAFHLVALLILVEAGIAFIGYHDIQMYSWGSSIAEASTSVYSPGLIETPANRPTAYKIWWASLLPAMALGLTLLSLKLVGDGLRDALDVR